MWNLYKPWRSLLSCHPWPCLLWPQGINPWGIIEVKCPFNARDMTPTEASKQLNNFMSTIKDSALDLSTSHDYYLQLQGQMALTGATWCDFVIYTKKGLSVQRIWFDEKFWQSKARLLSSFFVQYFLPKYVELKDIQVENKSRLSSCCSLVEEKLA